MINKNTDLKSLRAPESILLLTEHAVENYDGEDSHEGHNHRILEEDHDDHEDHDHDEDHAEDGHDDNDHDEDHAEDPGYIIDLLHAALLLLLY